MTLSPAQGRVFDFIRGFIAEKGYPPTRSEIAKGCGFRSPNAAEEQVQRLARKGAIRLTAGISRGITLTV